MGLRQAVCGASPWAVGGARLARRPAPVRASSKSTASGASRRVLRPSPRARRSSPRALAPSSSFAAGAARTAAAADPAAIAAAQAAAAQGAVVRDLKEKKAGEASKDEVDAAVAKLLELKKVAADLESPAPESAPDDAKAPPRPSRWASPPRAKITPAGTWT